MAQVLKKGAASLEKRQSEAQKQRPQAEMELRKAREADDRAFREKIEFSKLPKFSRTLTYITLGISYLIFKAITYRQTHPGHPDLWQKVRAAQSTVFLNEQGLRGENFMSGLLEQGLPQDWIILDDLRIPSAQSPSGYAQIDHVVISPKAVYCLKTKNWRGKYYRTDRGWITKYNYEHGIGDYKKDPIPQVQGHATALRETVQRLHYDVSVKAVVVFTNTEYEYLGDKAEIPLFSSAYVIEALLKRNLPPVVPDTLVLARKILAMHKDARHNL